MSDTVHLVKIPLSADRLAAMARRRRLPLRDLDDGYLCHCVLRELWHEQAPAPFVLRGRGRTLTAFGYAPADASSLIDHARAYGDPDVFDVIQSIDLVASKPMPVFESGRRLGFQLRACPVVRLGRGAKAYRPGAELDAFLAHTVAGEGNAVLPREEVYRRWLADRLNRRETTGVEAVAVRVAGFARERLVRRSQGAERQARTLERPDVRFEGDLVVSDGHQFNRWLAHGVGRHRAFGFGALMIVPPGTTYSG